MKVAKFTAAEAPFERAPGQAGDVLLGNVADEPGGGSITVGFGRYGPNQTVGDMGVADEARAGSQCSSWWRGRTGERCGGSRRRGVACGGTR